MIAFRPLASASAMPAISHWWTGHHHAARPAEVPLAERIQALLIDRPHEAFGAGVRI
jgi:hypothetical protein